MSQRVADLLDAALALSESDRAELADLLAASLSPLPSSLHPAWADELRRRVAEIESGHLQRIPWNEVRRQAQVQLEADGLANG
jgi:putative addiction module component (TIGR02574 family)